MSDIRDRGKLNNLYYRIKYQILVSLSLNAWLVVFSSRTFNEYLLAT